MATIEELHAALVKADAAGDAAGAKALADHIRTMSAAPAAEQPKTGMLADAWDGTKNLGLGLAKGLSNPVDGLAGLLTSGLSTAAHAVAPGSSADKYMQGERDRVAGLNNEREDKYQAMTPGSVAAGVGNVLGNIAVPLPGAAVVRGGSLLAKSAGAVKTGAVIGAAQPVYGDQSDYWRNKAAQVGTGAAIGGSFSAAGTMAGGLYNTVRPLVSPSSAVGNQILNNLGKITEQGAESPGNVNALAGADPAAVLARVKAAQPLVPGSLPTTAQVAGIPQLVMAEKVLRNNPAYRTAFEDRAIANNQARLTALQGVAKTPEELQAAIAARSTQTAPLYDAAKAATLPVDEHLQALLARPSAQQAIARGQKIARERGEAVSPEAAMPAVPAPASAILDANGAPFASAAGDQAAQPGTISGNMLQYMKMGLDDMQSSGRTQGIGSHEASALADTHSSLQKWIEANSPDYANANQAYAAASRPINTMQAGQDLYGGLANGTLNSAGDVAPALSQYRTQYAKALNNSPYGIDPEAQATLSAIQSDLQRETISNAIKSSGSDTFFNAQAPNWLSGKLFGNNLDGKSPWAMGLGGLIAGHGTLGMAAAGGAMGVQKMGQFVGNRVNGQFQKAMLEPEYFGQLLQDAIDRKAGGASVVNNLSPVGTRAATVGAENFLSPGR